MSTIMMELLSVFIYGATGVTVEVRKDLLHEALALGLLQQDDARILVTRKGRREFKKRVH